MSNLAGLLRGARQKKGWTLRQAAEATGISNGYLSLMEQGQVKAPSPTYLMALSNQYELSYPQLMELAGHPSGPVNVGVCRPDSMSTQDYSTMSGLDTHQAGLDGVFGASGTASRTSRLESLAESDADCSKLTKLLAEDLRDLTLEEIAQVRAFIAGMRAGRR